MRSIESQAIVLRYREMGESDLLVELLTRDVGKISGIAKAAKKSRRRFVNTFDFGHHIRVKFYRPRGRDLFLIENAALIDPHPNLGTQIRSMTYAAFIIELVRELAPDEERSADLFDTTALFLSFLDDRGEREDVLWLFVLKVLKISGIAPLFSACVRCRSKEIDPAGGFFVPEAGGMVCGDCLLPRDPTIVLSRGTGAALRTALEVPLERLSRIALTPSSLSQTRDSLTSFIDRQLGRRMRSADFIERYLR